MFQLSRLSYAFSVSIEGQPVYWLEKEPPRSIQTWDDLVSKFINQFFPPSKTTNLRNEITRFQQRFDESFYEAWDRFNDLLRACPHHGFSELHQLDTFYNALNINDQDSLNSAAGGNFLDKMPRECLKIIESKSKVRQTRAKAVVAKVSANSSTQAVSPDVAELKDIVRALLLDKKNQASAPAPAPAPVKAVELRWMECLALADLGSDFVVVDFEPDPRVPLILGRCFLKTSRALIDVHKGELTLRIGSEAITYNLDQTSRYSANYTHMTANKIDVIDMACEEYSQEVLGFTDIIASGNSTPYYDPIVATSSPTLTPFGDSDFLLLEEADSFLGLADDPDCPAYNPFYYDPEGDILILEAILNSEPPLPPPSQGTYLPEVRTELKELPPHLEYAFLEGDNKLPVIIAKELDVEEKSALVKVLKSHKRALAWKLSDIQGINPEF
ncbi:reverse transcriptase domain-containing protein [Tanacetum coccineum]